MSYEEILEEIEKNPTNEAKIIFTSLVNRLIKENEKLPRFAGMGKDLIISNSDDFDEPLEDMKELEIK